MKLSNIESNDPFDSNWVKQGQMVKLGKIQAH